MFFSSVPIHTHTHTQPQSAHIVIEPHFHEDHLRQHEQVCHHNLKYTTVTGDGKREEQAIGMLHGRRTESVPKQAKSTPRQAYT